MSENDKPPSKNKTQPFHMVTGDSSIPINMMLQNPPNPQKNKFDIVDGYESPDEDVDLYDLNTENRRLLGIHYDQNIGRFGGYAAIHTCNECKVSSDICFHCFFCDDYDLCEDCYQKKKGWHDHNGNDFFHKMTEPNGTSCNAIGAKKSTCEGMLECFKRFSDRFFIGQRKSIKEKRFHWLRYNEIFEMVKIFCKGLKKSEISMEKGSFVGIYGPNCVEWIVADFACIYLGACSVPLQKNSSYVNKVHAINLTSISTLIIHFSKLNECMDIQKDCKSLKNIIVIGGNVEKSSKYFSFSEILKIGKKSKAEVDPVFAKEDDLMTVTFTSGSSGVPKGVCYKDIKWRFRSRTQRVFPLVEVVFSNFSHLSSRNCVRCVFSNGGRFAFMTQNNMDNVFADFVDTSITYLSTPPRLLNVIYDNFKQEVKRECQKINLNELDEKKIKLIKDKIFVEFHGQKILGSRITLISTGGGPVSTKVKCFIRMLFQCPVYEGYGSSEASSICYNFEKKKGVELRDVPDFGYSSKDKPYPRGEIVIKNVNSSINQYFKDYLQGKKNSKIDSDGFYHTGDIGEMRGNYINVIDRLSNVIKLSQGEFICLERVEENFEVNIEYLSQLVIFPNKIKTKLYAIAVLDTKFNEKINMKTKLLQDMQKVIKKLKMNECELPVNISIAKVPFSVENEQLTVSSKKNRFKIKLNYQKELHNMFKEERSKWIHDLLIGNDEKGGKDSTLSERGVDSLSIVRIRKELKNKLNIDDISVSDILETKVSTLMSKLLEKKENVKSHQEKKKFVDFKEEEKKLKVKINEIMNIEVVKRDIMENTKGILITGATGFIGRNLCKELLEKSDSEIILYCICRKQSFIKMESLKEFWKNKIILIQGDLCKPLFGLSTKKFDELGEKLSIIIHAGAVVNHFYSFDDLYESNVISSLDIMKMGMKFGLKVHYVSSISAFTTNTLGSIFDQKHLNERGYGSTKWFSDCIFLKYYKNIIIHRLNLVGFSEEDGNYNTSDWLNRIVSCVIKYGEIPYVKDDIVPMNMFSIKWISNVMTHCVLKEIPFKEINYSTKNVSIYEIMKVLEKWMNEKGIPIKRKCETFNDWIDLIKTKAKNNKTFCLSPFISRLERSKRIGSKINKSYDIRSLDFCKKNIPNINEKYGEEGLKKWFNSHLQIIKETK